VTSAVLLELSVIPVVSVIEGAVLTKRELSSWTRNWPGIGELLARADREQAAASLLGMLHCSYKLHPMTSRMPAPSANWVGAV
jgi:hypothetical protein